MRYILSPGSLAAAALFTALMARPAVAVPVNYTLQFTNITDTSAAVPSCVECPDQGYLFAGATSDAGFNNCFTYFSVNQNTLTFTPAVPCGPSVSVFDFPTTNSITEVLTFANGCIDNQLQLFAIDPNFGCNSTRFCVTCANCGTRHFCNCQFQVLDFPPLGAGGPPTFLPQTYQIFDGLGDTQIGSFTLTVSAPESDLTSLAMLLGGFLLLADRRAKRSSAR